MWCVIPRRYPLKLHVLRCFEIVALKNVSSWFVVITLGMGQDFLCQHALWIGMPL